MGVGSGRFSRRAEHCAACSVGVDRRVRWELLGLKAWPRALLAADIARAGEESPAYCAATRAASCRA